MVPIRKTQQDWLPAIFNDFFENEGFGKLMNMKTTSPAINVIECPEEYKVNIAAPGMSKENFAIRITEDNMLDIYMEHKEDKSDDKKEKYLRREFSYSKFETSLMLPDDIIKEKINATMDKGILSIVLPKQKETAKRDANKIIEIK